MPAEIVIANYTGYVQKTHYHKVGGAMDSFSGKPIKNVSSAKIKSGSNAPIKLLPLKSLSQVQTNHGISAMRFLLARKNPRRSLGDNGILLFSGIRQYKCLVNGGYLGEIQKKLPQKLGSTPVETVVPEGIAIVSGAVKEGKTPVSRKVRLYRKDNGRLVREVRSDAIGNYQFDKLPAGMAFFVVSHDSNGIYNAAISDNITA